MSKTMIIEHRDPRELHIHPALRSIPELHEDAPEFLAIAAHMGLEKGITSPICIDDQNRIIHDEGRTLIRCAKRWQLKTVPVQVLQAPNVPMCIVAGMALKRHLSKSALAYVCSPLLNDAFEIARAVRLKQIADKPEVSTETTGFKTVEELANVLGFGRNLLFEARKVHELFADKKTYSFNVVGGAADGDTVECTLKEWFEPRILRAPIGGEHEQNRPLGLGGVIAGIASVKEGNKDKFNPKQGGQLELAIDGLSTLTSRMLKLPADAMRKTIRTWLDDNCGKLSDDQLDQLEELGETIKAGVKAQRKEHRA